MFKQIKEFSSENSFEACLALLCMWVVVREARKLKIVSSKIRTKTCLASLFRICETCSQSANLRFTCGKLLRTLARPYAAVVAQPCTSPTLLDIHVFTASLTVSQDYTYVPTKQYQTSLTQRQF